MKQLAIKHDLKSTGSYDFLHWHLAEILIKTDNQAIVLTESIILHLVNDVACRKGKGCYFKNMVCQATC